MTEDRQLASLVHARRALRRDILKALYEALPERKQWRRTLMADTRADETEFEIALRILSGAGCVVSDQASVRITAAGCLEFERMVMEEEA